MRSRTSTPKAAQVSPPAAVPVPRPSPLPPSTDSEAVDLGTEERPKPQALASPVAPLPSSTSTPTSTTTTTTTSRVAASPPPSASGAAAAAAAAAVDAATTPTTPATVVVVFDINGVLVEASKKGSGRYAPPPRPGTRTAVSPQGVRITARPGVQRLFNCVVQDETLPPLAPGPAALPIRRPLPDAQPGLLPLGTEEGEGGGARESQAQAQSQSQKLQMQPQQQGRVCSVIWTSRAHAFRNFFVEVLDMMLPGLRKEYCAAIIDGAICARNNSRVNALPSLSPGCSSAPLATRAPYAHKDTSDLRKYFSRRNMLVHPNAHIIFVDDTPSKIVTDANSELFTIRTFVSSNPPEEEELYMDSLAEKLRTRVNQLRAVPCIGSSTPYPPPTFTPPLPEIPTPATPQTEIPSPSPPPQTWGAEPAAALVPAPVHSREQQRQLDLCILHGLKLRGFSELMHEFEKKSGVFFDDAHFKSLMAELRFLESKNYLSAFTRLPPAADSVFAAFESLLHDPEECAQKLATLNESLLSDSVSRGPDEAAKQFSMWIDRRIIQPELHSKLKFPALNLSDTAVLCPSKSKKAKQQQDTTKKNGIPHNNTNSPQVQNPHNSLNPPQLLPTTTVPQQPIMQQPVAKKPRRKRARK
ncbi:hypothetical protein Pelo_10798 [Pelomyxa schiedti]|nr:hypothetical protein Pelo_10798 [Pelomyxa schiedti]